MSDCVAAGDGAPMPDLPTSCRPRLHAAVLPSFALLFLSAFRGMFAVIELGRQKQTRKTVCEQTEQPVVVTHADTANCESKQGRDPA